MKVFQPRLLLLGYGRRRRCRLYWNIGRAAARPTTDRPTAAGATWPALAHAQAVHTHI